MGNSNQSAGKWSWEFVPPGTSTDFDHSAVELLDKSHFELAHDQRLYKMPQTKAALQKHKHHIETLARGAKHERDYVLKTAPASLDPLLHSIAVDVVNGKLRLPAAHRTKPKIDGLVRFAGASPDQQKRMLRPLKNGQHGSGFLSFLGPVLGAIAQPLLSLLK